MNVLLGFKRHFIFAVVYSTLLSYVDYSFTHILTTATRKKQDNSHFCKSDDLAVDFDMCRSELTTESIVNLQCLPTVLGQARRKRGAVGGLSPTLIC